MLLIELFRLLIESVALRLNATKTTNKNDVVRVNCCLRSILVGNSHYRVVSLEHVFGDADGFGFNSINQVRVMLLKVR